MKQAIATTEAMQTEPIKPAAPTQSRYAGFEGQFIDGTWRPGREGSLEVDNNPFSGETLAEIVQANRHDLDDAYQAAARAQKSWAATLPAERAAIMLRSATIMEARRAEIVDWLIRESGSTRYKADLSGSSSMRSRLSRRRFRIASKSASCRSTNPGRKVGPTVRRLGSSA